MKSSLDDYANKYQSVRFERSDGILQMTFHTGGGTLQWSLAAHADLEAAFFDVANDPENLVVIITGIGDEFSAPKGSPTSFPGANPRSWAVESTGGRRLLENLLLIDAPVIAAVNGPAWRHCEIPLLSDIVLASDTAAFQDSNHFVINLVPGDGMHLVLPLVMGTTRARYFMLTGQVIDATQALEIGMVNEVLSRDQLLPRAWELARELTRQSQVTLRHTRICFTHTLRQLMIANQGYGLMLEGIGVLDIASQPGFEGYPVE
jgi:enoyl-CoA hydratase/carnithine racemase